MFDLLNSRNSFGKGFKQPLTKNRLAHLKQIILEKLNYLFNIETSDDRKLIHTGRKTFICRLESVVKSILEITDI